MAAKLLKMTNISKSFGSNKVLDGIEIEVDRGEVVALLGENGAGKSTLIKILGGIYHADTGNVYKYADGGRRGKGRNPNHSPGDRSGAGSYHCGKCISWKGDQEAWPDRL